MDTPSHVNKRSTKRIIITLVIAFGVILGLVALGFAFYQERNQMKNEISELQKSIKGINENDVKVQKSLDEIGKKLSPPETAGPLLVPEYSIATTSIRREPANPYQDTGKDCLFLDISIKNTSTQDGYIALSAMKFIDESNREYAVHTNYPVTEGVKLLDSQVLQADKTITGRIVYVVPHDAKKFVLSYDNASVVVSAQ